jgi:hypothetical protein
MRSRPTATWTALILGTLTSLALLTAHPRHATAAALPSDSFLAPPPSLTSDETVIEYDLSGPRLGATFAPNGDAISQFGWHFEHQASPGTRGPWFIVETVFLVGGLEQSAFVPNGNLIFGMRLPNSFEFGVGPSITIGGSAPLHSGIVVAMGQSFRAGGIRIPVNVAVALDKNGQHQVTLVTGWAIRNLVTRHGSGRDESL